MSSQPEITVGNNVQMLRFEEFDKGSHHEIFGIHISYGPPLIGWT